MYYIYTTSLYQNPTLTYLTLPHLTLCTLPQKGAMFAVPSEPWLSHVSMLSSSSGAQGSQHSNSTQTHHHNHHHHHYENNNENILSLSLARAHALPSTHLPKPPHHTLLYYSYNTYSNTSNHKSPHHHHLHHLYQENYRYRSTGTKFSSTSSLLRIVCALLLWYAARP